MNRTELGLRVGTIMGMATIGAGEALRRHLGWPMVVEWPWDLVLSLAIWIAAMAVVVRKGLLR